MTMNHNEILGKLPLVASGDLERDETDRILDHLAGCPECAAQFDDVIMTTAAALRAGAPARSGGLGGGTVVRVAAAAVLVLAGYLLGRIEGGNGAREAATKTAAPAAEGTQKKSAADTALMRAAESFSAEGTTLAGGLRALRAWREAR